MKMKFEIPWQRVALILFVIMYMMGKGIVRINWDYFK